MNKIELKNVTKAYGKNPPVIENLNLNIKKGSFTVLLGPSGCGKSTILRIIAGLEDMNFGDAYIEGENVNNIDPGDRDIAMVFQNYALYPNMSVQENIEFGLKNIKMPKEERTKRINEIAKMVGLEGLLARKPQHLSGGQRQRVALARAIVKKPSVFLMDEPLSNLDAKLRSQIRTDLIELYRSLDTTFVYVTHDQVEAMSMGTDIILLDKGVIQQNGSPTEIYENPNNVFTSKFIGSPPMNIFSAGAYRDLGYLLSEEAEFIGFRPEKARILPKNEGNNSEIFINGNILAREFLGDQILYKVQTSCGSVYVKSFDLIPLEYGECSLEIKKENLFFFDKNENRI